MLPIKIYLREKNETRGEGLWLASLFPVFSRTQLKWIVLPAMMPPYTSWTVLLNQQRTTLTPRISCFAQGILYLECFNSQGKTGSECKCSILYLIFRKALWNLLGDNPHERTQILVILESLWRRVKGSDQKVSLHNTVLTQRTHTHFFSGECKVHSPQMPSQALVGGDGGMVGRRGGLPLSLSWKWNIGIWHDYLSCAYLKNSYYI